MTISQIVIAMAVLAVIAYGYKKRKDDKRGDKKPPKQPDKTASELMGADFSANQSLSPIFAAAMNKIRQSNPVLYTDMTTSVRTYTLVTGFKIKDGQKSYSTLGEAFTGARIISYEGALERALNSGDYRNLKTHLYMRHIIHEYLHLKGYSHGRRMDIKTAKLIKSVGGKVNWPS